MAESVTAAASPTHNVPPPRPPPPKFSSSKTTEDLVSTKPRKPRARKFHSMHGRARADKPVPQRKVSLQEKLEEKVTLETTPSGGANSTVIHIDEVDHAVRSKSPSKSPSRDVEERSSPVGSDKPAENGALTTTEPVKPVEPLTQPQPNTSSSTSKDTLQSNVPTGSSKRYRSISVEDTALLSKSSAASEELMNRPRSKTLPRHLGTKQPSADGVSNKTKPAKKTPPPPIPTRPPVVMQYQNKNSDGSTSQFRHSQSNSVSSHSSTPSIPEETTAPPLTSQITPPSSPRVISPSPDLCTPEIKQPEQAEGTTKPKPYSDDVFKEASPKPELSPTTKGKKKLLSGFKKTFRRRPKSAGEEKEKSMTLGAVGSSQPIVIAHRRVKTVKEEVTAESRDQSLPGGVIPPIIVQCVAYLNRPMCLNEEGLFRIPGDMSQIRQLRDGFLAGKEMDLSEILEPHNVAGLLKLHYREMKLCLIPRGEMSREITRAAKARDVDAVKDILSQIPSENLALIRVIVELLKQVTDHSSKNQMTSGNLGASCGLSIFPSLQAGNASALLKCLVDHIETIFPE